jgi:hypothetical protein
VPRGYPGQFTNSDTGRVAPHAALRDGRSGLPESRPRLEELRSGKWVTEPAARVRPAGTGPARLSLVRS